MFYAIKNVLRYLLTRFSNMYLLYFLGKFLPLQRYHLAFTDLISGDSDIVFTLLGMPKFGILEKKVQSGAFDLLRPKDQFTQQDINDNLIR